MPLAPFSLLSAPSFHLLFNKKENISFCSARFLCPAFFISALFFCALFFCVLLCFTVLFFSVWLFSALSYCTFLSSPTWRLLPIAIVDLEGFYINKIHMMMCGPPVFSEQNTLIRSFPAFSPSSPFVGPAAAVVDDPSRPPPLGLSSFSCPSQGLPGVSRRELRLGCKGVS